jgi:hypothetical protein
MKSHVYLMPQDHQLLELGGPAAGNKAPFTDSGNDSDGIDQVVRTSAHNDPAGSYCSSHASDAIDFSEQAGLTHGNTACYGEQLTHTDTAILSSGEILPYGGYLTAGSVGQTHVNDCEPLSRVTRPLQTLLAAQCLAKTRNTSVIVARTSIAVFVA